MSRQETSGKAATTMGGLAVLIGILLGLSRCLRAADPVPELTVGEIILDAYDRPSETCTTYDDILGTVTSNPMLWSHDQPPFCTNVPVGTRWITAAPAMGVTVTADRIRYYAFGTDDCRIAFAEVPCP